MMGATVRYGSLVLCVALGACANLQTVSRRTDLPHPDTKGPGVAIHLDAHQRLVLYGPKGKYCAEPSPDAMAAYAASLGLGASAPGTGAASVAQALQSSAASIGLRTQSITLMRDALYRLCEAYANEVLSDVSATMLLARSQDLTAVVVAVEQLTGAVAANQALLTSTAAASASASLVANQQLLDAARKDEAEKEKNLADARTARDAQDARVTAKTADVAAAQTSYDNAAKRDPKPADELTKLSAALEKEKENLTAERAKLKDAEGLVKRREELLAESKRVREIIQDNKDAALTQAAANTGSAGNFSTPVQRVQLDKAAAEKIAQAVSDMVKHVLDKDYTVDACSTLLTSVSNESLSTDAKEMLKETRAHCLVLLRAKIEAQTNKLLQFGMDESSDRINRALKTQPELRTALNTWLGSNAPRVDVSDLLIDGRNTALRRRAIDALKIP